jgi:UDP-GlcNAc3NAcA epimerase
MNFFFIVGTRPQFLKLAPLSKLLLSKNINHIIVHSGQHYDSEMSDDIFISLNIKKPDYMIDSEGTTPIQKLSSMLFKLEEICVKENPDKIVVFGDCDTTIAGALVAKKLKKYLVHIEAGMRSYNKDMPEEQNRIITDHLSDLLLCSTEDSLEKLAKENICINVHFVGNLQIDLLRMCIENYNKRDILEKNNILENDFILLTIHREYNTNKEALSKIFEQLNRINKKIIFPVHPRTKNVISQNSINIPENITLIKPVNYLDMTVLERYCYMIITDSGGVQPEAWYLGKKCVILRSETEWIEPLKNNNNILYDFITPLNEFIENFNIIPIIPKKTVKDAASEILGYLLGEAR